MATLPRWTACERSPPLISFSDLVRKHTAHSTNDASVDWEPQERFSFYANKIVSTGEGGMVTTNDPELYKLARRLRDHAFSPERHFWHEYVAFNYRMTNLQAAIELAQTERLEATVAARRSLRTRYDEGLRLPRRDRVISL